MKRTIIIDTDNNLVELLRDGYNIIEATIYDRDIVGRAKDILGEIVVNETQNTADAEAFEEMAETCIGFREQ